MKKLLIIIACLLAVHTGFSQLTNEKAKLERERQEIQDEIREIQSNYNKVKGLKKESLAKLAILQRKIDVARLRSGDVGELAAHPDPSERVVQRFLDPLGQLPNGQHPWLN